MGTQTLFYYIIAPRALSFGVLLHVVVLKGAKDQGKRLMGPLGHLIYFLFLYQNICRGYSKHMFKLVD